MPHRPLSAIVVLAVLFAPSVPADSICAFNYLGALPGYAEWTDVCGGYAYCSAVNGLLILDVSDPSSPAQAAFLPLSGSGPLKVRGDYAYVTGRRDEMTQLGSFFVIDIRDPAEPTIAGECVGPAYPTDIVLAGDLAYVADSWSGVRVLNIGDPTHPAEVAFYAVDDPLQDLDLKFDRLYVADTYYGLRILDVQDPLHPAQIGEWLTDHYVEGVSVWDRYACVVTAPGICVLDVLDPAHPRLIGSCQLPSPAWHIALAGAHAYVSLWDAVSVIDLSLPAAPVLETTFPIEGHMGNIAVRGTLAFLSGGYGGLHIYSIADPSIPEVVGRYGFVGDVSSLTIRDGLLFLTGGYFESEEKRAGPGGALRDQTEGSAGLFAFDLTDPRFPLELDYAAFRNPMAARLQGDRAYVVDYYGRLGIFDVTDPTSLVLLGSARVPYRAMHLDVDPSYAYVLTYESGLRIFDIRDPAAPVEVGQLAVGSEEVAVEGDLAFVVNSYSGLGVVDVADRTAPRLISRLDFDNWTHGVAAAGNWVYVANGTRGLRVVDVSDPYGPIEVGSCDTPGFAQRVTVQEGYAYVADREGGVRVIDVRDPAHPEEIGAYVVPAGASTVTVRDRRIGIAVHGGGVMLVDLRISSATDEDRESAARSVQLGPAVPNPFADGTSIRFRLDSDTACRLEILGTDGRRVALIADRVFSRGSHALAWTGVDENGLDLPAGVYLLRLSAREGTSSQRVQLLR